MVTPEPWPVPPTRVPWGRGRLALLAGGVAIVAVAGVFTAPAVWDQTLGCPRRAEKELQLIGAEVITQIPPGLRSGTYSDTGCDSFGFASVSWTPTGDPNRTLDIFARAGWAEMSADRLQDYYDAQAVGYSKRSSLGTIEVVYVVAGGASFQAAIF